MEELLEYLGARSSVCRTFVEMRYLNRRSDVQVAEALGLDSDEYQRTRRDARDLIADYYASKLR